MSIGNMPVVRNDRTRANEPRMPPLPAAGVHHSSTLTLVFELRTGPASANWTLPMSD
jgi:hypothetical protein